jgi:ATP-dependent Lon protease
MSGNPLDPTFGFSGQVRLFPLPRLVMFPHVLQKLHIFEPRYRLLLRDSLAADGTFALATSLPPWLSQDSACHGIAGTACLGKIVEHEPLGDGRANILFTGVARVRLLEECSTDTPYRVARAELQLDCSGIGGEETAKRLCRQLREAIATYSSAAGLFPPPPCQTLSAGVSLGVMTDVLAYALPLEEWAKLDLLSEPNVVRRARLLLDILHKHQPAPPSIEPRANQRAGIFPAKFSDN